MHVVDAHTYLGHSARFPEEPDSALDHLIRFLDEAGVDQALVSDGGFTLGSPQGDSRAGNDAVAEAAARYPDRLLGVGVAQAPWDHPAAMLEEAERAVKDLGFVALRFHPSAQCLVGNDPVTGYAPAELAGELEVPLWIHTTEGPYSTPVLAADLAGRFPQTKFVLSHRGYATGGLALYFVRKHPNLFLDMSSFVDWEIDYYSNFVDLSEIGLHKLLFGSFYPLGDAAGIISIFRGSKLSVEEQEAILGRNALRLIGE